MEQQQKTICECVGSATRIVVGKTMALYRQYVVPLVDSAKHTDWDFTKWECAQKVRGYVNTCKVKFAEGWCHAEKDISASTSIEPVPAQTPPPQSPPKQVHPAETHGPETPPPQTHAAETPLPQTPPQGGKTEAEVKAPLMIQRKVTFKYHNHKAKDVRLAADFTGWKTRAMEKKKEGTWIFTVTLEPKRYYYKYVVDGQWLKDPKNPSSQPDGYGGESSVLDVN